MARPSGGAFKPATPEQPKVPKGLGVFGARNPIDDIYLFGTEAEILNRNATGYNVYGTPPENVPPSFAQIRPGPTSQSANKPSPIARQGPSKFGAPRRYA